MKKFLSCGLVLIIILISLVSCDTGNSSSTNNAFVPTDNIGSNNEEDFSNSQNNSSNNKNPNKVENSQSNSSNANNQNNPEDNETSGNDSKVEQLVYKLNEDKKGYSICAIKLDSESKIVIPSKYNDLLQQTSRA